MISAPLRRAFGYAPAPAWLRAAIGATLALRKRVKRVIHLEQTSKLIATTRNRTYPGNSYSIETIGPGYLKDR